MVSFFLLWNCVQNRPNQYCYLHPTPEVSFFNKFNACGLLKCFVRSQISSATCQPLTHILINNVFHFMWTGLFLFTPSSIEQLLLSIVPFCTLRKPICFWQPSLQGMWCRVQIKVQASVKTTGIILTAVEKLSAWEEGRQAQPNKINCSLSLQWVW